MNPVHRTLGPGSIDPDVGVNHRRIHVRVSQEILDRTDICAGLEAVCREAVPLMPSSA